MEKASTNMPRQSAMLQHPSRRGGGGGGGGWKGSSIPRPSWLQVDAAARRARALLRVRGSGGRALEPAPSLAAGRLRAPRHARRPRGDARRAGAGSVVGRMLRAQQRGARRILGLTVVGRRAAR